MHVGHATDIAGHAYGASLPSGCDPEPLRTGRHALMEEALSLLVLLELIALVGNRRQEAKGIRGVSAVLIKGDGVEQVASHSAGRSIPRMKGLGEGCARPSSSSIISQTQDRSLHGPQRATLMIVPTTTPTPRRKRPRQLLNAYCILPAARPPANNIYRQ